MPRSSSLLWGVADWEAPPKSLIWEGCQIYFLLLGRVYRYLVDMMLRTKIRDGTFQVVNRIPLLRVLQADDCCRCYAPRRQRREGQLQSM